MEWKVESHSSTTWDEVLYVEDTTTERLGTFDVRKYTFEKKGDKKIAAFAEGHTRIAPTWAMMYLSTLSGCPVGCKMCGTVGTFVNKLSAEQMIDQIEIMMQCMTLDEADMDSLLIKWMYMGEPMLNAREYTKALRYILEKYPNWNHVISTTCPSVDFEPLYEIGRDFGDRIEFTISIHGISELERNQVIPFQGKMTLQGAIEVGEKWFDITGRKVSYSYNLLNSRESESEVKTLVELFDVNKWIPCIQYMHTIDEDQVDNENRNHIEWCDAADAKVDAFMEMLRQRGYSRTQGYYTNRDELKRGCGSLIEFQSYLKR
ncbi:hypothetical protein VCR15J2_390043 [Vibrio coralliirubri]|uniref:hypothetical protein n=1 Tax=Vibrio coralliirubri TaxID=1516159 RepID=UPI000636C4C6|nr:hypothetical protein [Vibrio coralliirubri]CDT53094.1 hypothetical protein VCR15J2_390043 [Vibrio coralliirubri]